MRTGAKTGTHVRQGRLPRPRTPGYRLVRQPALAGPPVALDAEQALAAAHRTGPLLVVGGPGTGKTTILVEAVAARVAEGTDPGHILVLTFSRRAAARLRDRIEARIGQTAREPLVRTFPAYAFGLLRLAAAAAGDPPPRLLTGPEQDAVIREMLADESAGQTRWPESLRYAIKTRAFAAELRDLLLRAAERGVGPHRLAELGRRHGRDDWVAAAHFLREYHQVLALRDVTSRGSVAYDQAELVRVASTLLADDERLLAMERERCRYVYVDELADTDPAQLDLLHQIAGGGGHLVAFADPDSSTFAFRGADPAGVGEFSTRFQDVHGGDAPRLTLRTCYRMAPQVLAATRRVAGRLRGPVGHRDLASPPWQSRPGTGADQPGPAPVEVVTLHSATSEAGYVAHRLREAHLHHGVPWARMAVIVRSLRHQHAALRRALTQAGVPVAAVAEDIALASQPAVTPLLALIGCALDPARLDEPAAVALLHSPLGGADPFTERQLRQGLRALALAAGDRRPSGDLLVEALREPAELAAVDSRWARPARQIAGLIETCRRAAVQPRATAEEVLWAVWQASGLAERWAATSARGGSRGATADRDLDAVMVLFDAAARFTDRLPGARIEAFLHYLLDQQLAADSLARTADRGEAVRVLTAHAAKGLEWDVVVVAGVQEGAWPDLRLRGSVLGSEKLVDVVAGRATGPASQVSALLDEERRLFYVAASRARKALLVTAVDSSISGGGDGEEQPSRFLAELVGREAVAPLDEPEEAARFAAVADPLPVLAGEDRLAVAQEDESGVPAIRLLPRPLTLPALVAELRGVVCDPACPAGRRAAAAAELARLAAAGVPGADPDQWWGLRPLSDDRPLVDPDQPVTVSPSTVESVQRCGLRWLLERHGGSEPPSAKQGLGNLVHAAAMLAEDVNTDPAVLRDYVAARFGAIEQAAAWLGERERRRADQMIDKLLTWLAGNPRRLVAIEREFVRRLEPEAPGEHPVDLKGRVDRLEMDEDGRLVVIDLKTGSSAPTAAEVAEHAQLAAYQVAVEAGAFPEGAQAGGAEILALGTPATGAVVRVQPPQAQAQAPRSGWATAMVHRAARDMADSTFTAVVNKSCAHCAVKASCPVSGKGRQVTEA